jgi:hypothetical protein
MSALLCYKWQLEVKKVLDFLVKVWYNIYYITNNLQSQGKRLNES